MNAAAGLSGITDSPASTNSLAWTNRIRSRQCLEVAIVFSLILAALWTNHAVQKILGALAFSCVVWSILRSRPQAATLGLRIAGTQRSLWIVGAALFSAALAVGLALWAHTLHVVFQGVTLESSFLAYMVWALLQQFILQDFFLFRLSWLLPTRTAAVAVAGVLFAVAHLPTPLLAIAPLIWGIVACTLFLRYQNIYTLGLAHGILGISLAIAVPNPIHHQMRVGLGYLRWHAEAHPSSQPHRPDGIHRRVGDGRCHQPAILTPGSSVKDAREGC